MAGSYNHIVNEDGSLKTDREIYNNLDNAGDYIECITEMYGMIWWLADVHAQGILDNPDDHHSVSQALVNASQKHHQIGLRHSPNKECFAWIAFDGLNLHCNKNGSDHHVDHEYIASDSRGVEFNLKWHAFKEIRIQHGLRHRPTKDGEAEEPCDCAAHSYLGRECTCDCDHSEDGNDGRGVKYNDIRS